MEDGRMKKFIIYLITVMIFVSIFSGCAKNLASKDYSKNETQSRVEYTKSYNTSTTGKSVSNEILAGKSTESKVHITFDGNNIKENPSDFSHTAGIRYERPVVNTEEYKVIKRNGFLSVFDEPLSTFSIDVDTASYANVRRFVDDNMLPPEDAVRVEELINYFDYSYNAPNGSKPFNVFTEVAPCPWNKENYLVKVALKGKEVKEEKIPDSNLVFLIDVSGSMNSPDKLPLLKESFRIMTDKLKRNDRISIVTYSSRTDVILDSARGDQQKNIEKAINSLYASGSTAGGAGLKLAYKLARKNFIEDGNNRIILATDGDFNVGVSSDEEMEALVEEERKSGVFMSVLGFGTGNLKDSKMETIADKGNGNYSYIDGIKEAEKVLVYELSSTLYTIAKDVKIQIEFNPALVESYRLVGYENRSLENRDFNNDSIDAGELGAGHTVTAFYELVPVSSEFSSGGNLKYQKNTATNIDEIMWVKLRYKLPDENTSSYIDRIVYRNDTTTRPSSSFLFASSVAELGLLLTDVYSENYNIENLIERAQENIYNDENGYKKDFVYLARSIKMLLNYM
jgi:Ca-activated chloride channel family protein